ncbi:extracellular solute-binding protein [Paenibacillus flagellatus]|uniref:ABC transporter substrate-binding protein n=1 Tax=Paenibacillus flagellatus TaxID=2211139 RepID=A0A2V5KC26_9BACL|nr:extracellular solute-binding protein [Paenibacillus flagellatus]PYI56542.1 hypothetical protein DLM86_06115 [Paenibacillus flagellatus]
MQAKRLSIGVGALVMAAALIMLIFSDRLSSNAKRSETETDSERPELTWFTYNPAGTPLPPPETDVVRKAIEAKFRVRLNLIAWPPGRDYQTQYVGLLMANNAPDFGIDLSPDGGSSLILEGVYADLTPFVSPATMPNYFKYWMTEQELRQYQIHNRFVRAPVPYDRNVYRSYYIRKDWLDRLGLPVPESYEQYVETLRAFTFRDPDGNGRQDTYGFTTSGNGRQLSDEWPEFVKNGLLYPAYMENNRLIDMKSDPRVGLVVDDILRVMKEGLADPDWFLNQDNEHIEKAVRGKAGIVMGTTRRFAFDSNPSSVQARGKEADSSANWIPFNPFGANRPLGTFTEAGLPFMFPKAAADRHPENVKKTIEILDWLCGEEGFLLTHYGLEGKHYTRSGNIVTLLPSSNAMTERDAWSGWSFFTPDSPSQLGLTVIDPRMTDHDKAIDDFLARLPVKEKLGTFLIPPQEIDVAIFRAKLDEMHIKMLYSDKSGARWPEYREEALADYYGDWILQYYENQVRTARGTK